MKGLPSPGIWEFKVMAGDSWHAQGVLQEDWALA